MKVTKGDIGNTLKFTIEDEKGLVNLTGSTVSLYLTINNEPEITKPVNILNAATGQCEAILDGDIFTKQGFANVRIKVSFNDGKIFKSDLQQITIDN